MELEYVGPTRMLRAGPTVDVVVLGQSFDPTSTVRSTSRFE
jgi:hypothetical protein